MFNLIKADLYRLFKTKSYYIVGGILVFFCWLVVFTLSNTANEISNVNFQDFQFIDLIYNVLMNAFIVLLIGIEATTYMCTDYSSGYIKNIASGVKRKAIISISKFIVFSIGTIIYYIFMVLVTFILEKLLIGAIEIGNIGDLLGYIGVNLFLTIVMVGLAALSVSFFRNNATCIITLVLVILMSSFAYYAIEYFIGIDLTPISPIMNLQSVSPSNSHLWLDMITSGLVFLAVYLFGSATIMEKKDIK